MKKVFQALIPAMIAQVLWLLVNRAPVKSELWMALIVVILLVGGAMSAKFLIDYMQKANVERGTGLKILVGFIVIALYVLVFFFAGCTSVVFTTV